MIDDERVPIGISAIWRPEVPFGIGKPRYGRDKHMNARHAAFYFLIAHTRTHTQAILLLFALRPITRRSQALDSPPAKCNETGDRSGECRSAECDAIRRIDTYANITIFYFLS